jgi:large subunit ribosomal protein L3
MKGILGRKVEMSQVFDDQGRLVPVTLIQCGPCVVTQVKTPDTDGYSAVQLGLVERRSRRRITNALKGIATKAEVAPVKTFGEFRLAQGEAAPERGSQVLCDIFAPGDFVDVIAKSKGKGFQGVVKRHGFRGGAATHGSMFHRAPGSIGASEDPSRVFKNTKMGGHLGDARTTIKNLEVVRVDAENNLIAIKGAVPGSRNGLVTIRMGWRKPVVQSAQPAQPAPAAKPARKKA